MKTEDIRTILKKPIQCIKGIGQARAQLFNKIGIFTIEDVITYFPRGYEDRSRMKSIAELVDGEVCSFEGTIVSKLANRKVRRGLSVQKLLIRDGTGTITATWFNQHYLSDVFEMGERFVFYGKIHRKYKNFEIQNPVYEKVNPQEMKSTCRIIPVYSSTAKLTQTVIRTVIREALEMIEGKLEEILPLQMRSIYRLSEINYSIQNIHFPKSEEDFKNARFRLVFEELFLLQIGLLNIKSSVKDVGKGIQFGTADEVRELVACLPFQLTNAQRRVLADVERDMEDPKVMNRLVQGDVGSGKTIIAVLALYKAIRSGYQGALMAPTEILAEQHYRSVCAILGGLSITIALLTGSQTKKQKGQVLQEIREGNIQLVVGTHALLEENVEFHRLGLVVTDEQHRFGVRQRATLSQKGINPDILVMTATPIPRTLALILYGDLDISVIDELPPGRKPIETYIVDQGMRERINKFIRKKVSEGRQVYIVCPLVEDSEEVDAKSAMEVAERIGRQDFGDLRVGLVHGKMKARDKENVMTGFVEGRIDILVSTTVIEVGVNVPNATVMVIENAERFGLAQLHQLRGRVGRGDQQSYCILYHEGKTEVSKERMKIMQKTNDGFVISEKDLELRGPGDFFGTRQHGIPELKIANLYQDMDILRKAQEAAQEILKSDRELKSSQNAGIRQRVMERFAGDLVV